MMDKIMQIWAKITALWDTCAAFIAEHSDSATTFVSALTDREEIVITLLRAGAAVTACLGMYTLWRAISLNNTLPIAQAKQFAARHRSPVKLNTQVVIPILDIPDEQLPEKVKRPLVSYQLSDDAKALLEKITVKPHTEDGWNVAPGKQDAA